jgi:hypothetical protein
MSSPADNPTDVAAAELDPVIDADDLRNDAGDPDGVAGGRTELPLEADPADVAEQDAAVPFDEER